MDEVWIAFGPYEEPARTARSEAWRSIVELQDMSKDSKGILGDVETIFKSQRQRIKALLALIAPDCFSPNDCSSKKRQQAFISGTFVCRFSTFQFAPSPGMQMWCLLIGDDRT
jgi:hypothetical protein